MPIEFIREFPIHWRNERDVEVPLLREFLKKVKPATILDVGARGSLSYYFSDLKDYATHYVAVDPQPDGDLREVLRKRNWEYLVDDINQVRLQQRFDLVVCISTLEHIGINPFRPHPQREQGIAFNRMLEFTRWSMYLTFPVGTHYFALGDYCNTPKSVLESFQQRLIPYASKFRFFYTDGAQAGKPWKEHCDLEYAVSVPYDSTLGVRSLCVLEILR